MARPASDLRPTPVETEAHQTESVLGRTTARAFAAALSTLLIAALVVSQSGQALRSDGTASASAVTAGTVSLADDDQGRSLFELSDLGPNRPVSRCVTVTYTGTITPAGLTVAAEVAGDLPRFLDVTIQQGRGGGFDSCDGFEETETVFAGTLQDLGDVDATELGKIYNTGEQWTYRFNFVIQNTGEAMGATASAEFVWEVVPA